VTLQQFDTSVARPERFPNFEHAHAYTEPQGRGSRASFAHFEAFAAFCSNQKWPVSSVNERRAVCPKRSVQVFMFFNSGIPLAIFSDEFSAKRQLTESVEVLNVATNSGQHGRLVKVPGNRFHHLENSVGARGLQRSGGSFRAGNDTPRRA
jgi:hypothetical protein